MKKKTSPEQKNLKELFYSEAWPEIISQIQTAASVNNIRQQSSRMWGDWLGQKEVAHVENLLLRYSAWLSGGLAHKVRQSGLPENEAEAMIREITWQIRFKLYKHLDLIALNPEGHFNLSFLKYDPNMAQDIEHLRQLQAERKEPDRTKIALELIFSNPYTLLCETVCREFFYLINSAMLWRDRDLVPEPDLEERRKVDPHLSLAETEKSLGLMIEYLQDLAKKTPHRKLQRPPDAEIKRRINELLKQRGETAKDLTSVNRAISDVATYLGVKDPSTIKKSWYSKKKTS